MSKNLNYMEYKDEASYFLFSENKTQKGETHYNTHSHPRYEIMFSAEGGVEYVVENRRHELKKGDVLLVKPGLLHFAKRITCAPSLRYCIGFFPESIENGDLAKRIFDKGEHFALGRDSVFAELVSALRHKLENSYKNAESFVKNAIDSMILSLDDELGDIEQTPKQTDTSLNRVIDYVNANLTQIKSMDEIAEALFFSKSYLGHLFKKETGIGIMEYVRNKKVVRARSLIVTGAKPSEVYLECGFSNYPSFFRAYKAFYGVSPKSKKSVSETST